jgi:hypothetical protein
MALWRSQMLSPLTTSRTLNFEDENIDLELVSIAAMRPRLLASAELQSA